MLGTIVSWLMGGGVSSIGKQIRLARKDTLDAANADKRVEADKVLATLEARQAVMVAEAKGNWNVVARVLLAAPFGIFVWKVIVYDKVLAMGATDNLSSDLWNLMMVVYGFYFIYETASLFKRK